MRLLATLAVVLLVSSTARAVEPTGVYLEARTCQVYTGPCFANGEVGLTGKEAVMAWSIEQGEFDGVDLSGRSAVLISIADDTIGFRGFEGQNAIRARLLVDEAASPEQQDALIRFVRERSGRAAENLVQIEKSPIELSLNVARLNGSLDAGNNVKLRTRKARPGDCICSNESAYYPPLSRLSHFAAGVTIEGEVSGRGLGTKWSIPDSRSSYMGTF